MPSRFIRNVFCEKTGWAVMASSVPGSSLRSASVATPVNAPQSSAVAAGACRIPTRNAASTRRIRSAFAAARPHFDRAGAPAFEAASTRRVLPVASSNSIDSAGTPTPCTRAVRWMRANKNAAVAAPLPPRAVVASATRSRMGANSSSSTSRYKLPKITKLPCTPASLRREVHRHARV